MEEDIKVLKDLIGFLILADSIDDNCDFCGEIKAIENILNELKRLQKENEDWQKAYQEEKDEQFNMLTKKCSHCGNDTPLYCEKCYQELITKNAELQLENEKIKTRIHYKVEKCERKLKNNISGLKRLLLETKMGTLKDILYEEYYTSDKPHKTLLETKNERLQLLEEKIEKGEIVEIGDSIPKQKIRDKIQLLEKELKLLDKNDKHTLIENDYIISVLKELLGE